MPRTCLKSRWKLLTSSYPATLATSFTATTLSVKRSTIPVILASRLYRLNVVPTSRLKRRKKWPSQIPKSEPASIADILLPFLCPAITLTMSSTRGSIKAFSPDISGCELQERVFTAIAMRAAESQQLPQSPPAGRHALFMMSQMMFQLLLIACSFTPLLVYLRKLSTTQRTAILLPLVPDKCVDQCKSHTKLQTRVCKASSPGLAGKLVFPPRPRPDLG